MFVLEQGWKVPASDRVCFRIVQREVRDLDQIIPLCENHRTVVQAGGNIGIWPKRLARDFDRVVTLEPDPENHEALVFNVGEIQNIEVICAALGSKEGRAGIDHFDPGNIGAHQIDPDGDEFDVITIDSLALKDVDLIQLDIEGSEHFAIEGAIETILEYSPVIVLELKGIGERYGKPDSETYALLDSLGYNIHSKIHRDVIFVRD